MTELVWDGKYKDGKKVGPVRIALPFQTVETVNETAQERQLTLDMLFAGHSTEWRNRLIWGDKKYVLPSLLAEFAGKVNLIYIDPPFATGADFSFTTTIPESGNRFTKEPSIIEQKAYRDTWGRGLDGYLQWFYETVILLHELLAEDGSIYVHCDWRLNSCLRSLLDEVFGSDKYINEIVWKRTSAHSDPQRYGINADNILFYSKNTNRTWNNLTTKHDEAYIARFRGVDTDGRKWADYDLSAKGLSGGGYEYEYKGVKSLWRCPIETMKKLDEEGKLHFTKNGGIRLKRYLDENKGTPLQFGV